MSACLRQSVNTALRCVLLGPLCHGTMQQTAQCPFDATMMKAGQLLQNRMRFCTGPSANYNAADICSGCI